jgi:hypothetical protein
MPQNYKKRRAPHGPSKNELRAARNERAQIQKDRAGTLRQRFPEVGRLELDFRFEAPAGNALDHFVRTVGPDEPLQFELPCPSTCGGGRFSLLEAVEQALQSAQPVHEGMNICEMASYMDSRTPCGTKLYYRISIHNKGE